MTTKKEFSIFRAGESKGFTLIELLVVIAIIGLLSSVVLASLNSARRKGGDASIKSNLSNIRTQAELFYDTGNTYTGLCTDATVANALASAKSAAGITAATNVTLATAGSGTTATCHVLADGSGYAVEVPLRTNSANGWCVDSAGSSREITGHLAASDVAC